VLLAKALAGKLSIIAKKIRKVFIFNLILLPFKTLYNVDLLYDSVMISLKLNTYLLGLLSVFFLLNSYIWAIVSPIGSGIDDDFHLPSVWCAFGDKSQICETVIEGDGFVRVPTALVEIK
jgi:hypothetical protein